jgi:hypothetical protein
MAGDVIKKLYIITQDQTGHLHHYSSKSALMHADVLLEFNIDLDNEKIIEKGFILNDCKIFANYDIRDKKTDDTK